MGTLLGTLLVVLVGAMGLAGCGSEIGDSCQFDSECSPAGDRVCATGLGLSGGYCTVIGCDYDSCPDESVCVRFFSLGSTNILCDPATEDSSDPTVATNACSTDEFCTLGGSCVPRSAETRYCMRKCGDDGDCRDNYHCRTRELMTIYGGEPVLPPETTVNDGVQAFCASAPPEP